MPESLAALTWRGDGVFSFRGYNSVLMTGRQFFDWQTGGGDVTRMIDALEHGELSWCVIGDVAVNHWAAEPIVTRDVDFVVGVDQIESAVRVLSEVGFVAERHQWSINFKTKSQVSL